MVKEIIEVPLKTRVWKVIPNLSKNIQNKLSRPVVEKCPFDGGTFLENVYMFDKNSLLGYHMFSTPI